MNPYIITVDWLNENLNDKNLVILDTRQKNNKAGLISTFKNIQIKGAIHFDIKNEFSDFQSLYPNMLIDPTHFEEKCQASFVAPRRPPIATPRTPTFSGRTRRSEPCSGRA